MSWIEYLEAVKDLRNLLAQRGDLVEGHNRIYIRAGEETIIVETREPRVVITEGYSNVILVGIDANNFLDEYIGRLRRLLKRQRPYDIPWMNAVGRLQGILSGAPGWTGGVLGRKFIIMSGKNSVIIDREEPEVQIITGVDSRILQGKEALDWVQNFMEEVSQSMNMKKTRV